MVGHAALAFALAAFLSHRYGLNAERALAVGVAAGAFAVVPDVDMGYAFVGVLTAGTTDIGGLIDAFWNAGLTVHRGLTHSLLVGGLAAVAFGLLARRDTWRFVGVATLAGMVAATLAFVGPLEAGVLASVALAGAAVALLARSHGLSHHAILGAALVGMLTHPFGDLFTGTTPTLFYPLDVRLLPTRVEFFADPTLHLLAAFGLELATIWLALGVYLRLRGGTVWPHVHRRAVLGAAYGAVVLALPPPTLDVSYHFVFSVLAVGVVGVSADLPVPSPRSVHSRRSVLLTGLAAITIALLAYGGAYLLLDIAPSI